MKYCLIGKKLSYSFSGDIHRKNGFDYGLKEIPQDKLDGFLRDNIYDGFNVTIPYKEEVLKYMDYLSPEAEAIGSVNTVKKSGGLYYGFNTDVLGMEYAITRAGADLKGMRVLIAGSGGTRKTAEYLCRKKNALSVNYVSRTGEINYTNCYDLLPDTEVIINATPVGTSPDLDGAVLDVFKFKRLEFVFDCVYNPLKTQLILNSEKAGIKCSGGLPMLIAQAVAAEKIWESERFSSNGARVLLGNKRVSSENECVPSGNDIALSADGRPSSDNGAAFSEKEILSEEEVIVIERIYKQLRRGKLNITLTGMPSCGKTSVGKILAEKLNKTFIDTDEEIKKSTGKSAAEIILKDGEQAFRDIEEEIIKKVAAFQNRVISTGGGAVIRPQNVKRLSQNGIVIYIERDLALLTDKDRPVSIQKSIEKLFEERKDLYEKTCDYKIKNDATIDECVIKAVKVYEDFSY